MSLLLLVLWSIIMAMGGGFKNGIGWVGLDWVSLGNHSMVDGVFDLVGVWGSGNSLH